jgi:hypothetical protein
VTSKFGRPIWLLDFDGVINAIADKPDRTVWPDWIRTDVRDHRIAHRVWYSPTVIALVNEMHEAGVEIRWLSTWHAETEGFAALGLPELPGQGPVDDGPGWWKLPSAIAAAGESRPLLWTDDELNFKKAVREWVDSRTGPTHLIAPGEMVGLAPRRVREIRSFLTDWL